MVGPHPGHRAVADPELCGQQPARPVGDAERLGRWREDGGQDLSAPVAPDRLGTAGAGSVSQLAGQLLAGIAAAPGNHRWAGDAESLSDLAVETPSAANNSSLARRTSVAGAWTAPAQRRRTASSAGATTRAAAEEGIRRWSSPFQQQSNHLRNEPLGPLHLLASAGGLRQPLATEVYRKFQLLSHWEVPNECS